MLQYATRALLHPSVAIYCVRYVLLLCTLWRPEALVPYVGRTQEALQSSATPASSGFTGKSQ